MKHLLTGILLTFFLSSCAKEGDFKVTIPVVQEPKVQTLLGDAKQQYQVWGTESFHRAIANHEIKSATENSPRKDSLLVAFPKKLLGENFVFGGVITKVSDPNSEVLGNLKLSDLPPIFVKPTLRIQDNQVQMELKGCLENCTETSNDESIISTPVVALDENNDRLVLDLAAIGEKLNLVQMLDPKGEATQLKTVKAQVAAVDFSLSTLVFDVEVQMAPLESKNLGTVPETRFTVRWYLRLGSVFNPSFVSRDKTDGVGFFMTERSLYPKIERHSLPRGGEGQVKYFIKNIPKEYQNSFRKAFESWNEKFIQVSGSPLLQIEFVDPEDPRSQYLVPGDIRYNILEWDLNNQASYGGLGPSIANQFTGEILSSNVLIQGPRIVQIYKKWFQVSEKAEALKKEGRTTESHALVKEFLMSQQQQNDRFHARRVSLVLGSSAAFKIHSQLVPTQDPAFQKEDFEVVPTGVGYDDYMNGYFLDMVAHELGHNLGLRHNFSGNLGAAQGAPVLGKVSASVMQYLGRAFRYLDEIGPYDVMAIKYGYTGVLPESKNRFCTDEDVPDKESRTLSAECSRDDATTDPFGFFMSRLHRAVGLIIARGTAEAPVWKAEEMIKTAGSAVHGMAFYASSAGTTGNKWVQFFNKPGRPRSVEEVPSYVWEMMRQTLCPSDLDAVLAQKSKEARIEMQLNHLSFIKAVNDELSQELGPETAFNCQ